jgi:predicted nucleic acid-binding protein
MIPLPVDSSLDIQHLRAGEDVRQPLLPHLNAATLYNCGVVRTEVLRGLKSPRARDGMAEFVDIVPEVPCDARAWREISRLGWELGQKGKWPPVTGLAIAVCAMRVNAAVATLDSHFAQIPRLKVIDHIP